MYFLQLLVILITEKNILITETDASFGTPCCTNIMTNFHYGID